jgi:VIT1/CCC1 family predicted Fe2+/Mn2+ transporter
MLEGLWSITIQITILILALAITWLIVSRLRTGSRILKALKTVVAIGLLAINAIGCFIVYSSITRYYEEYPRRVDSLASLKLGMSYEDLLFIKGTPKPTTKNLLKKDLD